MVKDEVKKSGMPIEHSGGDDQCSMIYKVIKLFCMLNSDEYEISTAHLRTKMVKNNFKDFSCFQTLRYCIHHVNECKNANNCCHLFYDKFPAPLS